MSASATRDNIGDYQFTIVEAGSGPPLLFVHSSVSDHRTFATQLEVFSADYRAIAYSRRFHWPNAPIAQTDDYAMDQHVADLAAVIEALRIAPARLVGHSYGAYLCLQLAIRRPDLVQCMVLAEPPVVPLFVSDPPRPAELVKLALSNPAAAAAVIKFGAGGLAPATKAFRAGQTEAGLRTFGSAVLGD